MTNKTEGWIVLSEDGNIMYDFSFSLTRKDAQRKYTRLWSKPNWKAHYRKGIRCVKATRAISLIDNATKNNNKFLRHLIDVVWNNVTESNEVPSTIDANKLINKALKTFIDG